MNEKQIPYLEARIRGCTVIRDCIVIDLFGISYHLPNDEEQLRKKVREVLKEAEHTC